MLRLTRSLLITGLVVAGALMGCQPPEQSHEPMGQPESAMHEQAMDDSAANAMPPETLATGPFVNKGEQKTTGTYRIERTMDSLRLVLAGDFATDEGPDLHVVLSPVGMSTVSGKNAMADDAALTVGPLKARSGTQEFTLPDDTNLRSFDSVLIHCIRFSHLYGAAPLQYPAP